MARKGRRPQSVKGFRPGKEPAHLKKRRAKAQLGADATWAQKQAVEAVAGRSPREVEKMARRWTIGLVVVAALLVLLGALLYPWAVPAGIAAHVVAAVLLFLAYRVRKQTPGLVEMADSMR